ncbi:hypothetical protein HPP92_023069 [Vanilla planifolia]|uniref:Clp R domain-containing protein n=1 Tax=Vanilla planifolia TaxID=51239 RepID=A0A835UDS8_VANPL|nr:hypothetical protein HPP92_023069 [Vanilla planifolia]
MRAGGCTVQQALTAEAAAVVKQAVSLARRRGHAQVTPLHVASTLLSSSSGLLRSACLHSHSHPLQCKALELCFNVALNRLPVASTSSSSPAPSPSPSPPLLSHHHHQYHHQPSLSNALVAAFKRAQAHQRRGSIETQQQPLLPVKIELEQLVVSILDDPSVSRVMREAGFSSTQVKSNVEQAISSSEPNPNPKPNACSTTTVVNSGGKPRSEDVSSLVEGFVKGNKRSLVVVGECLGSAERVVKGLMDRVDQGQVPETLRNLQFITLPLFSFRGMSRGEVELKLGELNCLLKRCCLGRGAVLYLEDLKWIAEFRTNSFGERGRGLYCPVEHVIMEIGRLVCGGTKGDEGSEGGRGIWLMGIATYQTYMKCKIGSPSLELLWGLQPLTTPVGSLELALNCDFSNRSGAWRITGDNTAGNLLTFCSDSVIKLEKDAECHSKIPITSNLPSWLQKYKEENGTAIMDQNPDMSLHFSSTSPSSSSVSSYCERNKSLLLPATKGRSFGSKSRASPCSSDGMDFESYGKFKEVNAENLKVLCNALEKRVPWQTAIIPEIASTILQCRAGMTKKSGNSREDTWLFFQGGDVEGKEKIGRELASLVFGTEMNFYEIGFRSFSPTKSDSSDFDVGSKRSRSDSSRGSLERLADAFRENPHRVFFVEDAEQMDLRSQMGFGSAIKQGRTGKSSHYEVTVGDAIVILSCECFDSRSRACSPHVRQKLQSEEEGEEEEKRTRNENGGGRLCLDLNLCAGDDETPEVCSLEEDEGLLEAVDGAFFFKLPQDL